MARRKYVLAVSTTWPPVASGSGRAFRGLISGVKNLVALVPRSAQPFQDEPWVKRGLRFAGRAGGPLKIHTILQHAESALAPLIWSLRHWQSRPALLICNQTLFVGVGGRLLKFLGGVPYVVYAMGEEFTGALRDPSCFRARRRIIKWALRGAAGVVCISHFTRRVLQDEYGVAPDRLHVIHPKVDIDEQQVVPHCALSCKKALVGERKLILMVGRLAQQRKGFDKAIEALPRIRASRPDVALVIAGPGDQAPLRALAQRIGVREHVVWAGEVERAQLLSLYAACDVFLLPTRTMPDGDVEGFGMVFLEANLMGKPVVGGRSGGTDEAIVDGQTGLLVDGNAIEQVAQAVVSLLQNPVYAKQIGERGKRRVLQEFDSRTRQMELARIVDGLMSAM